MNEIHATTILCVRRGKEVALAGDGQVTLGNSVMKGNAVKVRRLHQGKILAGFAGAVADAFTLFDRLEKKLEQYSGDLTRAAVETARDWRTDKSLRRLDAMLIAADKTRTLLISGGGEVIEPEEAAIAAGSGGDFARSAALALLDATEMGAEEIARRAMAVAGKICIYTNDRVSCEVIKDG